MIFFSLFLLVAQFVAQFQHVPLDKSIRKVKWARLLAHDKVHFLIDSAESEEGVAIGVGKYFRVKQDSNCAGYLDTEFYPILYRDLNHDGREDAILTLDYPGSGHWGFCLIFLQSSTGPKFVGCVGGAHYVDSLCGNTLLIITAHLIGFDAQCCNRAHEYQRIVGVGDSVRFLPMEVRPVEGKAWITVEDFYNYLDNNVRFLDNKRSVDMPIAYQMLSPAYQASHPYAKWLKGYATMDSVRAEVDQDSPDSAVRVKITSYDKIDGRTVIKHFAGVWHLKFITNNRDMDDRTQIADWFLDRPEIREVK